MIIRVKLINLSITSHTIMWEEEKYFFHPLKFWWPWKNRKVWDTLLILETTNEILGQQVKAGKKVRILTMPAFCISICSVWLRKEGKNFSLSSFSPQGMSLLSHSLMGTWDENAYCIWIYSFFNSLDPFLLFELKKIISD